MSEQHQRISLFVKSKVWEIKRRLDHLEKQAVRLDSRRPPTDAPIPIRRLERYGQLETDILKAGDEIQFLSRFVGDQRTAFRKLLKKYKKWTGSVDLEQRFKGEILNSLSSFTKIDVAPLVDEWSDILYAVRSLFEKRADRSTNAFAVRRQSQQRQPSPSAFADAQNIVRSGTAVDFDTLLATLPLGKKGKNAVYWVHPDNVVELQILLLQHARTFTGQKRRSSAPGLERRLSQPPTPESATDSFACDVEHDTFGLVADDLDEYVKHQSSLTLEEREDASGALVQHAAVACRWTKEDHVLVTYTLDQSATNLYKIAIKRKYSNAVLDPTSNIQEKVLAPTIDSEAGRSKAWTELQNMRKWLGNHRQIKPLAALACNRTRFFDLTSDASGLTLASLDQNNEMDEASHLGESGAVSSSTKFPFAVLRVRQEGAQSNNLVRVLDQSHLVERVRGFSMEYHAVWQCCEPKGIAAPYWVPLLDKDIRKVPQAPRRREDSGVDSYFGSQSTTPQVSTSTTSVTEWGTDSGAAMEEPLSKLGDSFDAPPLSAFKKKRKRRYAEPMQPARSEERYWNEYDDPEDDDENGYVIYVDPNAESTYEKLTRKLRSLFNRSEPNGQDPLLSQHDLEAGDDSTAPTSDAGTSSDEDDVLSTRNPKPRTYGTLAAPSQQRVRFATTPSKQTKFIPRLASVCLTASIVILLTGFLLAATGRRKQAREVDGGILFAVACSLTFAVLGVASMLRSRRNLVWPAWAVALGVLGGVAVGSGGLLAWILT